MVIVGEEYQERLGIFCVGLYLPPPGQLTDVLTYCLPHTAGNLCPEGACVCGNGVPRSSWRPQEHRQLDTFQFAGLACARTLLGA